MVILPAGARAKRKEAQAKSPWQSVNKHSCLFFEKKITSWHLWDDPTHVVSSLAIQTTRILRKQVSVLSVPRPQVHSLAPKVPATAQPQKKKLSFNQRDASTNETTSGAYISYASDESACERRPPRVFAKNKNFFAQSKKIWVFSQISTK